MEDTQLISPEREIEREMEREIDREREAVTGCSWYGRNWLTSRKHENHFVNEWAWVRAYKVQSTSRFFTPLTDPTDDSLCASAVSGNRQKRRTMMSFPHLHARCRRELGPRTPPSSPMRHHGTRFFRSPARPSTGDCSYAVLNIYLSGTIILLSCFPPPRNSCRFSFSRG